MLEKLGCKTEKHLQTKYPDDAKRLHSGEGPSPCRLESMSLEFGCRPCPMACTYCYHSDQFTHPQSFREPRPPLSWEELLDVLDQAVLLGLGGIGIIGPYEPLREEGILPLVRGARDRGLRVTVFTKGPYFSKVSAKDLCDLDVTIGIGIHSLKPTVHDQLTGVSGSFRRVMSGLETLLTNGYATKRDRILVTSVIVKQNLEELPELWRWAREHSFVPFFEQMTIKGRAHENVSLLHVSPCQLHDLFSDLAEVDASLYGLTWAPHPPWAGESCMRHLNSCHLTFDGYVQPCTGVDIPIGNVRDVRLASILAESQVIRDLRSIRQMIKGSCKTCRLCAECYGCRGQAYQVTGDYLAADPSCWYSPRNWVVPETIAEARLSHSPRDECHRS